MSHFPKMTASKQQVADKAIRLARLGDLDAAAMAFADAIALDSRNLDLPYNLAIVEEQRGDVDRAASLLTTVLHRKPNYPLAASRLSRLLARYQLEDINVLALGGLRAALLTTGVAHQPIVDAALCRLIAGDAVLRAASDRIQTDHASERDIGRELVARRTADGLAADLLHLCLRLGIVRHPALERLLTGVRAAILLDCDASRFEDRAFTDLALALVAQGWNNDHAWAETGDETNRLAACPVDRTALLSGDREAVRRFTCAALYRSATEIVLPPISADDARQLKPRSLRDTIETHLAERRRQSEAARTIPSLRPLADATSIKVAGQYEAAPYPRWHSLHVSRQGAMQQSLEGMLPPARVAFMSGTFDVLIAGCGTGQQALQAATAYGQGARLLALDLSRASLAYAAEMAKRHRIENVSFIQGDILDADLIGSDFDVVECVGVLHHMADWRAGWRALLQRLKPGGLMYIGLYSATSRRSLRELRMEAGYPGPGCSDAAARAYRRALLLRNSSDAGHDHKGSRDFHALSAFRDLVLHESEAHVTLGEIAEFLDQHGLVFRGFTLESRVVDEFFAAYPTSVKPGSLADWAAFEINNPRTFDAMYRFWVERRN